jgi:hypothetical protein
MAVHVELRTLAGDPPDDALAPIPAIRRAAIELVNSTQSEHSLHVPRA